MKRELWVTIVYTLLAIRMSYAQTIHYVPTDFENISAAISAAASGDFIVVRNGTYTGSGNTNLDPQGKSIVIRSENGAGSCFINCGKTDRAFIFQSNETNATVVQGFTIKHGFSTDFGGAVFCYNSSPLIENCTFENNKAAYGAAIASINASPHINDCFFLNNTADQNGGGVFCANSLSVISSSVFAWNFAESGASVYSCWFSQPHIVNSLIKWNSATRGGGLAAEYFGFFNVSNVTIANNSGTGVYCDWGNISIRNSILYKNMPQDIECLNAEPDVTHCRLSDKTQGQGNIESDPLYAVGSHGEYYLGVPSGPDSNPCVDAGDRPAEEVCWTVGDDMVCIDDFTTQADDVLDTGTVDLGCHFVTETDCLRLGVCFDGPEKQPELGELVGLDLEICNPGAITHVDVPLFVIMEVEGEFWFYPTWSVVDYVIVDVVPGRTVYEIFEWVPWPEGGPDWFENTLYAALTDRDITEIWGEIGLYPYRFDTL